MTTARPPPPLPIVPLLGPPSPDIISSLVSLHQAAISHDNSLMRFHPPFTPEKTALMHQFWATRLSDLPSTQHYVFLALSPPDNPLLVSGAATNSSSSGGGGGGVVGVVDMFASDSDTQSFRLEVEMLMVHPAHRGRGLAKRLLSEVETKARELGRTLLVLNTTKGSEADLYLYPRLGWVKFGELPGYGLRPGGSDGKEKADGVYYYKDLSAEGGR